MAPTKEGDVVSYTITVTNNGDLALSGLTVSDANAVLGTCSVPLPATLSVGASLTCAATHVVTNADVVAGKVDNTAVATSSTGTISKTSNVVTVPLTLHPAISITKQVTGALPTAIGGFLYYEIVVTNTGNVVLHDVAVTDPNATITGCTPVIPAATLAIGDHITCLAKHAITAADAAAGKVINVASVTTKENVTASSGSTSNGGSTTPPTGNPTTENKSNEVVTPITFKSQGIHTPGAVVLTQPASKIQNPKIDRLAFTGDELPLTHDSGFYLVLLGLITVLVAMRRLAKKQR